MVRLRRALSAEVLVALAAANSELAHVEGRLPCDGLAVLVLLVIVNLSLHDLHYGPAAALDEVRVRSHYVLLLDLSQFFFILLC